MVTVSPTDNDNLEGAPPAYTASASSEPHATISLSASISSIQPDHLLLTITPPKQPEGAGADILDNRAPVDICCVIDVSG
jgi:hypothetical protein